MSPKERWKIGISWNHRLGDFNALFASVKRFGRPSVFWFFQAQWKQRWWWKNLVVLLTCSDKGIVLLRTSKKNPQKKTRLNRPNDYINVQGILMWCSNNHPLKKLVYFSTPTQTMHCCKGNLSKIPWICIACFSWDLIILPRRQRLRQQLRPSRQRRLGVAQGLVRFCAAEGRGGAKRIGSATFSGGRMQQQEHLFHGGNPPKIEMAFENGSSQLLEREEWKHNLGIWGKLTISSWWLNQPIWRMCASQLGWFFQELAWKKRFQTTTQTLPCFFWLGVVLIYTRVT